MKWLKWIGVVLVVLLIALVFVAKFYLGSVVKVTVEKAGPAIVGVPIKLEQANIQLVKGLFSLKGFVLGNPEGFKTENAISVGEITIDIDMKSLLSDTIVIKRFYVKDPKITYEMGIGKSNIGKILEQVSGNESTKKPQAEEKSKKDKGDDKGKKVIIDDFLIEGAMVRLSAKVAMGAAAPIPLPPIHLTGIGREKDSQGASPVEVIKRVLGAIADSATKIVTGSLNLVGDGVEAVGKGAMDAAGKTVDTAGKAVDAVSKGAVDAAGKTVDAVGKGAGKVVGGVKGLIGLGDKEKKPEAKDK
ncbi:MAG: hypothetical protein PHR77_12875 [Kiritimatiellae bacterium]|nr:hypothetical protein [Kiritimatiellia bacterium]MDD5521098.1 hypothetical protein [Kiritimatiellia bacterium]